jgi:hypothetical protein
MGKLGGGDREWEYYAGPGSSLAWRTNPLYSSKAAGPRPDRMKEGLVKPFKGS